jgi:macrolide transport system ATP-binding/permease protein
MNVLTFSGVEKSYGDRIVLKNVETAIRGMERVGVVGANGAGKSTLLKLAAQKVEPDYGSVKIAPGVRMGYLPQTMEEADPYTIREWLERASSFLRNIEIRMERLAQEMATATGEELDQIMSEYGELVARFERMGGYEREGRFQAVIKGLRLDGVDVERAVGTLSGGQKARVGLASLLIATPDLLIMDEPTNHLDEEALSWLETFLQQYRGTVLIASHDRMFLNRTVTRLWEIDEHTHQVRSYPGNYEVFRREKEKERKRWQTAYDRQQQRIRELRERIATSARQVGHAGRKTPDKDKFAKHYFRGRVENAIARNVRQAEEELRRIMDNPVPRPPNPLQFRPRFDPKLLKADAVVTLSDVHYSLSDGTSLLQGIHFILRPGDRHVITGANGVGKTTLLDVIAERKTPASGMVMRHPQAIWGYLRQEEAYTDRRESVLSAFSRDRMGTLEELIARLLSFRLFRYEELDIPVGALSPGEYRKLQLARLMDSQVNVLLLDEPTNHFSPDLLEELERALEEYPGTVIAVSHDRWFLSQFRGTVWELRDGRLKES